MLKRLYFLITALMLVSATMLAQVTTSSMTGRVTAANEAVIGATITAKHTPSGTVYRGVTNSEGRYSIQGMRAGGPYVVEISYLGYQPKTYSGVNLVLAQNMILDATLNEGSELLAEVVVVGATNNNMRLDRAGAVTNVNAQKMAMVPTVSRSMNDILKLTPQGGNTGSGFAVGGGNYRQSFVTVDGAAFNNAFGIGSNLPAGGSPISLDALDQISVSVSPFDVRQSGFTGGSINATTKSGTNSFKGSAYIYNTNVHLRGNKVGDYEMLRNRSHSTTYGVSLGGPIIKDKLFFFINGEYESNISAGPSGIARAGSSDKWTTNGEVHRPTVEGMNAIQSFLQSKYNYNPGRYQGYSLDEPAYRLLARLDWNINDDNKLNFRFSRTHTKYSSNPSASTSPLRDTEIYPGGVDGSAGRYSSGRTANTGLYFESSRYMQEQKFTSFASEWNSRFSDAINNTLRLTYSYQDEPRSYVGGTFPTVDILENGSLYASFGPDPFTAGNLRQVKTFVATDELTYNLGIHNILAGLQYETNQAVNGFAQAANGYYVFSSFDDFKNGLKPSAYGITFSRAADGSMFQAKMKYNQFSFYLQDQMNISDHFRLTAGLRMETSIYPKLKDNFNEPFSQLDFNGKHFSTDQLPGSQLTVSPRIGFNWDIAGNRKYVLRGGTGYFVGRLPFVWLVSAVGNSGCGQVTYYYNKVADARYGQPDFQVNVADQLKQLTIPTTNIVAPSTPTVIDTNLKMNAVWKTSLAFDAKLPGEVDFSIEGIYSKDFNPAIVTNENRYWDGTSTIQLSPNDTRRYYSIANRGNEVYYITNAGNKAYSYSITTSLAKAFAFGLDLSASYTYSYAKSYGDGIGDQVSSAYFNNRFSIHGNNEKELGYATYVAPHRLLLQANYRKEYGKHFATSVGLIYEGMNMGYAGGYGSTRYSYTMTANVVNDYGSNSLLYIPGSREELDQWNFTANGTYTDENGNKQAYTADMQRDDFWAYINQDSYLKNRKGQYTERGGVMMPWHHQLDLKVNQDFFIKVGGKKNTLQLGVDIKNLPNLLNSNWGTYKRVNNYTLLKYSAKDKSYQFQKNGNNRLTETYSKQQSFSSTYSIQFSLRYFFN